MTRTNASLLAIAVFAGASALAFAEDVDLSKVDRSIRRQPAWKSGTPQYCLFVVSAEKRVWFVVDGDDLYMDINANGDLTDAGEKLPRLERSDEQRGETRNYNRWQIPDIAGADGQPVVKNISLEPQGATGAMRVYFETVDLSRAFVRPTFATAAKDAPIIHPTGPLQLELKVQRIKTSQYGPDGVRRSRPGFSVTGQCYVHGLGPGTKYATETPDLHCKMEFPLADGKTVAQEMILYLFADWGSNRSNSTKIPFDVVDGNVRITVSVARPAAGKAVPKPVVIEKTVAELGGAPQLSQAEWDALAERAKSMGRAQPVPVREALLTIQGGRSMALSPDGKRLAVLERIENPDPNRKQYSSVVKLLDAATYKELVRLPPFAGHGNLRYTVVFSADGSRLAACNASTAMVWDATSGRELLKREGLKRVYALALSPNGKLLAYGSPSNRSGAEGSLEVVDVASGTEGLTLKQEASGARLGVNGAAFSPDGTRLATVDKYEVVTLWNTANGEAVFTMKRDNRGLKWFSTVAFSPDGTRLAVAYVDSTVSVWNALTGEEALRLEGHFHTISSVAFSPDGKQLATGGSALNKDLMPGDIPRDAFVRLWDAESGVEIVRLKGFSQIIDDSLAFSPDGRRLLATENDTGQIKVWDVTPGPTDEVPPKD